MGRNYLVLRATATNRRLSIICHGNTRACNGLHYRELRRYDSPCIGTLIAIIRRLVSLQDGRSYWETTAPEHCDDCVIDGTEQGHYNRLGKRCARCPIIMHLARSYGTPWGRRRVTLVQPAWERVHPCQAVRHHRPRHPKRPAAPQANETVVRAPYPGSQLPASAARATLWTADSAPSAANRSGNRASRVTQWSPPVTSTAVRAAPT